MLVQSSMEYLNLQVQSGRAAHCGIEVEMHSALPYEIREKIKPPLPTIKLKMKTTRISRSNDSSSNGRKKSFKYGSVADDLSFRTICLAQPWTNLL